MKPRVLTGTKKEIAESVLRIEGDVRQVTVFLEEPEDSNPPDADMFAEMDPYTVRRGDAVDSRDAVYRWIDGE